MKIFIKEAIFIASILLAVGATAQNDTGRDRQIRPSIRLGAEIKKVNLKKNRSRALSEHLIIPKGDWQLRFRTSAYRAATANI